MRQYSVISSFHFIINVLKMILYNTQYLIRHEKKSEKYKLDIRKCCLFKFDEDGEFHS